MTPTALVLLSAAFVLSGPERWAQGVSARDDRGAWTPSDRPAACSWCVGAAITQACFEAIDEGDRATAYALSRIAFCKAVKCTSMSEFNDRPKRTHDEILEALYAAALIANNGEPI